MARADSTITVKITGDSKGLGTALDKADTKVGGFGTSVAKIGGLIAGAFAVDAVFDFAQTALAEADRVGDALTVLEAQLGTDITNALDDAAEGFTTLGLSRGDVLELEGAVADTATALGLAKDEIGDLAPDLVTAAGAIALITDSTPDEVIGLIGKAAAGSEKALRELGINLTDDEVAARAMRDTGKTIPGQLTDTEKAAARYSLILEKLDPKIRAVTDASGDLEQSQKEVQAKFENLTAKIGEQLQGPLNDLTWVVNTLDKFAALAGIFGDVIEGIEDLAAAMDEALPDLGAFGDQLNDLLGALGDMARMDLGGLLGRLGNAIDEGTGGGSHPPPGVPPDAHGMTSSSVTINVPPTGAQTEAAVVAALRDYQARNGPLL